MAAPPGLPQVYSMQDVDALQMTTVTAEDFDCIDPHEPYVVRGVNTKALEEGKEPSLMARKTFLKICYY